MAKDFPADKYDFRAKPEVRSFGEVIVHVHGRNAYATKVAGGDAGANWDKEDVEPKQYKGKGAIVAAFQNSVDDVTAVLAALPPDQFNNTLFPTYP